MELPYIIIGCMLIGCIVLLKLLFGGDKGHGKDPSSYLRDEERKTERQRIRETEEELRWANQRREAQLQADREIQWSGSRVVSQASNSVQHGSGEVRVGNDPAHRDFAHLEQDWRGRPGESGTEHSLVNKHTGETVKHWWESYT